MCRSRRDGVYRDDAAISTYITRPSEHLSRWEPKPHGFLSSSSQRPRSRNPLNPAHATSTGRRTKSTRWNRRLLRSASRGERPSPWRKIFARHRKTPSRYQEKVQICIRARAVIAVCATAVVRRAIVPIALDRLIIQRGSRGRARPTTTSLVVVSQRLKGDRDDLISKRSCAAATPRAVSRSTVTIESLGFLFSTARRRNP